MLILLLKFILIILDITFSTKLKIYFLWLYYCYFLYFFYIGTYILHQIIKMFKLDINLLEKFTIILIISYKYLLFPDDLPI